LGLCGDWVCEEGEGGRGGEKGRGDVLGHDNRG